MDLSNAAASRHLSALETRLGARLAERNTPRRYLTDTGREFLSRAKNILADLKDAESAVNGSLSAQEGDSHQTDPTSAAGALQSRYVRWFNGKGIVIRKFSRPSFGLSAYTQPAPWSA
ncbi:LysR family transcriptional regulator [Variovorax paradoxus]|uniref:LysR family transcriptional regulator n=1 Tax=Variovorax paradoxus TaxID=34073 RepID=UPI00278A4442|nr:LysR family transcriptional regulator [Variovorax paradoxus]MDP9927828.1 DNA-binding transcriptional LysR family regulator [Variovorax paradoxus]